MEEDGISRKKKLGLVKEDYSHFWTLNGMNHDNLVEFQNIFVIKGNEIYFGRRGVVYVNAK